MLVGRIFSIHLAFVEAPIFVFHFKKTYWTSTSKNIHTKTQNESPVWLAKIKWKPHCQGKSHFGEEKMVSCEEKKEALELSFKGKSNVRLSCKENPVRSQFGNLGHPSSAWDEKFPEFFFMSAAACMPIGWTSKPTFIHQPAMGKGEFCTLFAGAHKFTSRRRHHHHHHHLCHPCHQSHQIAN